MGSPNASGSTMTPGAPAASTPNTQGPPPSQPQ
jgi:hypothetical protein